MAANRKHCRITSTVFMMIFDTKKAAMFRPLSRSLQNTGRSVLKTLRQKTQLSNAKVVCKLRNGRTCHSFSSTTKASMRPKIAEEPEMTKRKRPRWKVWRHHWMELRCSSMASCRKKPGGLLLEACFRRFAAEVKLLVVWKVAFALVRKRLASDSRFSSLGLPLMVNSDQDASSAKATRLPPVPFGGRSVCSTKRLDHTDLVRGDSFFSVDSSTRGLGNKAPREASSPAAELYSLRLLLDPSPSLEALLLRRDFIEGLASTLSSSLRLACKPRGPTTAACACARCKFRRGTSFIPLDGLAGKDPSSTRDDRLCFRGCTVSCRSSFRSS
mmetsp:Transcript_7451/g.17810  ORF Transcript_7451/g.17810 Transcript_7451/m.17810 type:complete len:328 (+) Transcript_7451:709-1692(+)